MLFYLLGNIAEGMDILLSNPQTSCLQSKDKLDFLESTKRQ